MRHVTPLFGGVFIFTVDTAVGAVIQFAPSMKKVKNDDGTVDKIYERGDGIRKRYRDALDPLLFTYPRPNLVHHELSWYTSGKPRERPLFGIYALAAFAENMLHRARYGRFPRPDLVDAMQYFAQTRRALQNVLSGHALERRLPPSKVRRYRKTVDELVEGFRELVLKNEISRKEALTPMPVI